MEDVIQHSEHKEAKAISPELQVRIKHARTIKKGIIFLAIPRKNCIPYSIHYNLQNRLWLCILNI